MRTVIWFAPGLMVPAGRANDGGMPPRPPPPAPRPPAGGAIARPFTQTSPVLRIAPNESVGVPVAAAAGTSIVRVNQTTPSKSGRPRDSQLPGTCMSFQSAAMSLALGRRQSGLSAPSRSATGSESKGSAALSAL